MNRDANIAFVGITSTKTPIGDGFIDVVNEFHARTDVFAIIGPGIDPGDLSLPPDRILSLSFTKFRLLSYFLPGNWIALLRFFSRNRIRRALFYSTSPINAVISRLCRIREQYIWVHDPVSHPGTNPVLNLFKSIDSRSLFRSKACKRLFVASSYLRDVLSEKHSIANDVIEVIPFPCIGNLVEPDPCRDRNIDVLFFGRIEPYKDLDTLLKALIALHPRQVNSVLCGDGGAFHRTLLHESGATIHNRYVPDDDLKRYLATAKICVFPYTSATGTQTVPTALANGCMVFLSDIHPFRDYVATHGERVRAFPPGDFRKLATLIADELAGGRTDYPAAARSFRDRYSVRFFAENIASAIF